MKFDDFRPHVAYEIISYTDDFWRKREGEPGVFSCQIGGIKGKPYEVFIWGDIYNGIPNRIKWLETKEEADQILASVTAKICVKTGKDSIAYLQSKIDKLKRNYGIGLWNYLKLKLNF